MKIMLIMFFVIYSSKIFSQTSDSSESNSGILYGPNHVFTVTAPAGWVLDNHSGVSQGIQAVFYPKGGSWEDSPTVMYAHGTAKDSIPETIEEFISNDSLTFKERDYTVVILDAPSLQTKNSGKAKVKWFFYSQYEAVAYIDKKKSVAMLVLTSRTQEEFNKNYSTFEQLVVSYFFVTDVFTYPEE